MIYDAIAAITQSDNKLSLPARLIKTTEYLHKKKENDSAADKIRSDWVNRGPYTIDHFADWAKLAIPSPDDLETLVSSIPNSWTIQFIFTLATPYMSKGIEAFDLLDNPIIRDKVFEVPIVPASSWKGGLRSAATIHIMEKDGKTLQDAAKDERIIRLFGNDRKADENFSAGRLSCFPTGFQYTKCEVINPHDRARRVGTVPILLECVPAGEGIFTVLYVPFGEIKGNEVAEDLKLCAEAIKSLLTVWGIGAKKSNGNGLAKDHLKDVSTLPHPPRASENPRKKQRQEKVDLTNLSAAYQQQSGEVIVTDFEAFIKEANRLADFLKGRTN